MRGGKREGSGRPSGAKNKRTAAIEAAAQAVAERFKTEVPAAFDGDGVAFLQIVYRDPSQPIKLRVDAAIAASKFERPTLAATITKDITPLPTTSDDIRARLAELVRKGLLTDARSDGSGNSEGSGIVIDAEPERTD